MDHDVVSMAFVDRFGVFVVAVVPLVWVVIVLCGKQMVVPECNLVTNMDSKAVPSLVHTCGWIMM